MDGASGASSGGYATSVGANTNGTLVSIGNLNNATEGVHTFSVYAAAVGGGVATLNMTVAGYVFG